MNYNILTIKLEINPVEKNKEKRNVIYKKLWGWQNATFKMSNLIINNHFFNRSFEKKIVDVNYEKIRNRLIKNINKYKEKLKNNDDEDIDKKLIEAKNRLNLCYKEARDKARTLYCESEQNTGYSLATEKYPDVPSYIRSAVSNKVYKEFKNMKTDIESGNKSLINYKKNISVPFMSSAINNVYEKDNKFYIKLFNIDFLLVGCHKDNNNKKALLYIIDKGNKVLSNSSYSYNKKKKKFFLNVSIKYEKNKRVCNKNIVVGIDIGYRNLVYCTVNNGLNRISLGNGNDILIFYTNMKNIINKRNSMFLKKGGKGRYKKLKDVYDLKKIKGNYVNTLCHTISKRVIDFVIKANAGTIHLEFLKGMDKNNFLSKYFPYYKLQTCIKYKAENEGIEVKYVDPSYTSQICSVCGNKDKEQRKNMSKFFICKNEKCKNYGKEVDADYNASVNISNSKKYVSKITECEYCNNR